MIQKRIAPAMTRWLAISNRENSGVVIRKHIWGVPNGTSTPSVGVAPGDTVQVYVGQKVVDKSMNWEGHF